MLRLSLFFLSAAIGGSVLADEPILQPEVMVTASRFEQGLDATLADVSVISRADIENSATRDISDLLRLEAGFDIARTGGPGGQTSIFLRGSNNNHVLVLIDGVRASALGTGVFTWETLPLDSIERIEIVRGPRASYWGSDAIGGVVQIFTRRLDAARASLGYGSHGDAKADAGFGQRGETGGFSIQLGARDRDGFPSQNENGFSFEDKDHGLRNRHLALRGDQRVGSQVLDGIYLRSQGTAEFSGGQSNFRLQNLGLALDGKLAPRWQHRLQLSRASEDYETPAYFSAYESRRNQVAWQNHIAINASQQLIFGIDWMREQGRNLETFGNTAVYDKQRRNTGVYAGWQTSGSQFESEISLRTDDNSLFGNNTTGSVAAGWRFNDQARLYASHGEGFRGPSLNEQFSPGFGGLYAGNPDLQPEQSRSQEIGFEWKSGAGQQLKVNAYSSRVRNLISFSGVDFQAENVARARIRGAEFDYRQAFGPWLAAANLTWQIPRNEDSDSDLLRRPREKFSGTLERRFGDAFQLGAEWLLSGSRDDVGGIELPGYGLLNLRASWQVSPQWKVLARIENVNDRDYELARGYNTPGRSGFVELIWSAR